MRELACHRVGLALSLLKQRLSSVPARKTAMKPTFATLAFAMLAATGLPVPAAAQITDRDLGERVAEQVRSYSKFSIFDDVTINVDNRNVVLTGRVTIPLKREEIEKRVARIDGIRSLTNDIGVLPVSQTDDRLRRVIANAIYNHPNFWRYAQRTFPPIHIIVEHQRVTLTGVVENQGDKILAYSLAQVTGVLSVENRLQVSLR
jgi:hyperosmotically inducible protein